jgi:hypothetical protein
LGKFVWGVPSVHEPVQPTIGPELPDAYLQSQEGIVGQVGICEFWPEEYPTLLLLLPKQLALLQEAVSQVDVVQPYKVQDPVVHPPTVH